MRKLTKIWLIIAASLVLIGAIIFTAILSTSNWDFSTLNTVDYQTNTYTSFEHFKDITIDTETADITFIFTEINCTKVVCHEMEKAPHNISFDGEKLLIKQTNRRMWYDHIGINFDTPQIKIYLPNSEYGALDIATTTGDVSIPHHFQFETINFIGTTGDIKNSASISGAFTVKLTTGDIHLENTSIGSLNITNTTGKTTISDVTCFNDMRINVSTGKMNLTNVKCKNFSTDGTTGDIAMENVVAEKMLFIARTTGDVKFSSSDASFIHIRVGTGDITGSLLTGKIFTAESSTGKVSIPENTSGGTCVITTNTGDIKIDVG